MKYRPILFSAPMVRALLDGSKTQTRRVVNLNDRLGRFDKDGYHAVTDSTIVRTSWTPSTIQKVVDCPYGQPGDRLWVRETFTDLQDTGIEYRPIPSVPLKRYVFAADIKLGSHEDEARKEFGIKWRPSIFMPRTASRITLEVTGVRVERLQDISEVDCIAEGIERSEEYPTLWKRGDLYGDQNTVQITGFPKLAYRSIWEAISGHESWHANPWVWVVEFKQVTA